MKSIFRLYLIILFDLNDLDVQWCFLHQPLFIEELQMIKEVSGVHLPGVVLLAESDLHTGVLGEQEDGQRGGEVLDEQLAHSGDPALVLAGHQEVWFAWDHGPVDVGDQLAEHDQGHTRDEHIVDIEATQLLISWDLKKINVSN